MNRLQLELERLYGLGAHTPDTASADFPPVAAPIDVRALVLELALPAGWEQLCAVWRGVQADLELPAPAISVSGRDALQLWFSLAAPVSPSQGARFLRGLVARYLAGVSPKHVRLLTEAAALPPAPSVETGPDRWSAFVTPDLAAVFADTPWLDVCPTDEGQATLLRGLVSIKPVDLEAASSQLDPVGAEEPREAATSPRPAGTAARARGAFHADAVRFLARVMNDETAPLASRIDAARALLAEPGGPGEVEPGPRHRD